MAAHQLTREKPMTSVRSIPSIWCLLTLALAVQTGCGEDPDPVDDLPHHVEVEQATFAVSAEDDSDAEGEVDRNGAASTEVHSLNRLGISAQHGAMGAVLVRDHVLDRIREYLVSLRPPSGGVLCDALRFDCNAGTQADGGHRPDAADMMCPDCVWLPELESFFPGGLAVVCPDCVDVEIEIDTSPLFGTITDVDLVRIPAGAFYLRRWSVTVDGHLLITLVLPSADVVPSDKARVAIDVITTDGLGAPASHTVTDVPWSLIDVQPAEPFRVRTPDTVVD